MYQCVVYSRAAEPFPDGTLGSIANQTTGLSGPAYRPLPRYILSKSSQRWRRTSVRRLVQVVRGNVPEVVVLVGLNVVRFVAGAHSSTLPQEVAMNSLIDFAAHRLFSGAPTRDQARRKAGFGFLGVAARVGVFRGRYSPAPRCKQPQLSHS